VLHRVGGTVSGKASVKIWWDREWVGYWVGQCWV